MNFTSSDREALLKRFGIRGIPALIILGPDGQELTRTARVDVESNPDSAIQKWTDAAIAKGSMKKKSDTDTENAADEPDDDDDDTTSASDGDKSAAKMDRPSAESAKTTEDGSAKKSPK